MSCNNSLLLSEDDIRTKVVYQWLKDCGFSTADIWIEYSINIRIGKGIKTINSRADVLVKSTNGLNLLIVEVKRPDHPLDEQDKKQALSYARSLAEGGIAPFTILTNGNNVIIYDSVTGYEISGETVPVNHPYVKNGFCVSGDSLSAKAEALEYLISISPENLLTFCKAQVEYRMALLKGDDVFRGKKYIPKLHVKRLNARKELDKKLLGDDENKPNQFVLVVGSPQHGKTCFMCNTIESYIKKEIPALFYPAISLKKGLLNEIQEDFEWFFGNQISPFQIISKLRRITQQTGKEIIIFIDGWNEMLEHALVINDECQRLKYDNIKLVLSTTSPSVSRLLQDEAANITFVAEELKLNSAAIQKLTSLPLENTKDLSIVQIGEFNNDELRKGKKLHERAYNTKFTADSNVFNNPFYLRLAAEVYANKLVPSFATRTLLLKMGLIRKAAMKGIKEIDLFTTLNEIANITIEKGTPFCCMELPSRLQSEKEFSRWIESGLFIYVDKKEIPGIDFYYSYEKNYSIAIINRKLHEELVNKSENLILNELQYIIKTEDGQDALHWFFSCPEYSLILKKTFKLLVPEITDNKVIIKIFADAILTQVNLNEDYSYDWLEEYIIKLISINFNQDESFNLLSILIYALLRSIDEEREKEKYKLWMRLLVKYDNRGEELGIEESLVCQYYGVDNFKGYCSDERITTLDIEYFDKLILDEDFDVASNAASYLTYAYSMFMLERLPFYNQYYEQNNFSCFDIILEDSCCAILAELSEMYYGGMCPGALDEAEKGDHWVFEEYYRQKNLWRPTLKILHNHPELYTRILYLLNDLSEYLTEDDQYLPKPPENDPNQLKLDFEGTI